LRPRKFKVGRWNWGLLVMAQNYRKGIGATNSIHVWLKVAQNGQELSAGPLQV
jgi:hypothetical protein